jgi:hypothetical protein
MQAEQCSTVPTDAQRLRLLPLRIQVRDETHTVFSGPAKAGARARSTADRARAPPAFRSCPASTCMPEICEICIGETIYPRLGELGAPRASVRDQTPQIGLPRQDGLVTGCCYPAPE